MNGDGIHIFGIRHHGPGSARSLQRALTELQPDIILVEGPPDADDALHWAFDEGMKPPVALLVYMPDEPQRAVYYPQAVFSPEWQAIQYGYMQGVPVRFMDLPQAHQFALRREEGESGEEGEAGDRENGGQGDRETGQEGQILENVEVDAGPTVRGDPLGWLAQAAGYSDGERWWEQMVEQRRDGVDLFRAILEAMTALREASPPETDPVERLREAWMRQTIRAAQREGYTRIAVVCGAWHSPSLQTMPPAKDDVALLKGLPKCKVAATWVPWTHGRLAYTSGYGAGIESPGWYEHLWTTPEQIEVRWLTRVARLLRGEDLDASSAHVIEAVRLAEALAAMRERPRPGLAELTEATQTVLLFGDELPLQLIHQQLIVGEVLGQVPDETPQVPLQSDLTREQRRLRFQPEALEKTVDLDLRKPNDLERSHLLHRLHLLGIPWGRWEQVSGKTGTFHELWRIRWEPHFAVSVIEASMWGNTVAAAAAAYARHAADHAADLPALTRLVDRVLLAAVPDAMAHVLDRLQAMAALANDVGHLLAALPPLVSVVRYGNVRRTDTVLVAQVIDDLVPRVCIGLPLASAALDDASAATLYEQISGVNSALQTLEQPAHLAAWRATLRQIADQAGVHGLVAGGCCRILLQAQEFDGEQVALRLSLALSTANEPRVAAAWIEGLLRGSGLLLVNDRTLLGVLDKWVAALPSDTFTQLVPLLRRTFTTFAPPERQKIGNTLRHGEILSERTDGGIDAARAAQVLPLVAQLLGLSMPHASQEIAL